MNMTERRKRILRAVVEHYIETAEPVGSKIIADLAQLDCSSATIRNEMATLEKMGYLEQPHTSAGRIPSPAGYRFYVNELMEKHKLSMQETERINEAMHLKMRELDRVIDQAGKLVSQFTNYPAFALTAGRDRIYISRYDLLMVDPNSFIVVAMTNTNVVKKQAGASAQQHHRATAPAAQRIAEHLLHRQDTTGNYAGLDAGGRKGGGQFLRADLPGGFLRHGGAG